MPARGTVDGNSAGLARRAAGRSIETGGCGITENESVVASDVSPFFINSLIRRAPSSWAAIYSPEAVDCPFQVESNTGTTLRGSGAAARGHLILLG